MIRLYSKALPTVAQVHINEPLTDVSIGYMQKAENFIASRVFPIVPVNKQSDLYYVYNRDDWYRIQAKRRAPGTESAGGGYQLGTEQYHCHKYAVHIDVDDDSRANEDNPPLDGDEEATLYTTQQCMMIRELEWMQNYFVTGQWANETTPSTLWDVGGSTPIEDIRAAKLAIEGLTGYTPNVAVCGARVWNVLQDHPDFVSRVNSGQTPGGPAMVNRATVASVLEIEELLVSKAVYNVGLPGGTSQVQFMSGDHFLLAYRAPNPGRWQPSAGYIFTWRGLLGAGAYGGRMKKFRMEALESDRVECELAFDQKPVATDLAHFFLQPITAL